MTVRASIGSGTAEQVCHDHRSGDVAGRAQNEPQRGVGVEALGEVGMVGEADDVETRVVGQAGVPEHLAHLVNAGLQPEAEEDFVVGDHHTNNVRDEQLFLSTRVRSAMSRCRQSATDEPLGPSSLDS